MNDFAIFILSHGRPDNVYTFKTLQKHGYTGKTYIIIDDTDKSRERYIKNFGEDNVVIFNKQVIANKVDQGDNLNDLRTTTHARNAIFEVAEELGYKYFMQFDDDYTSFRYRFIDGLYITDLTKKYNTDGNIGSLDNQINILLDFLKSSNRIKSIAIAQGGDFIGGEGCSIITNYINVCRKCMNSFICSTDRKFHFISRLNEDVNTYITLGSRGDLFLTLPFIGLEQKQTQETQGGMTETYIENGTYQKSFFSVMYCPAFVKIGLIGKSNRIHHSIKWINAVPKIISEKNKKK